MNKHFSISIFVYLFCLFIFECFCHHFAKPKAGLTRARFLRNFLVQDIAGHFTRSSIFLDKKVAATILRLILRKFLAEPFTRDAFSNIAAMLSNIANSVYSHSDVIMSAISMRKKFRSLYCTLIH